MMMDLGAVHAEKNFVLFDRNEDSCQKNKPFSEINGNPNPNLPFCADPQNPMCLHINTDKITGTMLASEDCTL